MHNTKIFLSVLVTSLVLTIIFTKKLIPILLKRKYGQKILEIGPYWHKSKEGTPTMGGLGFVLASITTLLLFASILYSKIESSELLTIINVSCYALLNGLIGMIDDMAKLLKKKNEGLTPLVKFLFQSIVAILFLVSLRFTIGISTELYIPFFNFTVELGWFYYVLCYLILCGMVNAVNLTDGVDGLASSIALTVGGFFACANALTVEKESVSFLSAILIGATVGFLIFNLYPAKVFMGDTGSLFLGGLVVGLAFAINNPLLVLLFGFVFALEAGVDILQVLYFKLTHGKRLFKMAPLHHHFEKCGWSEMKIVYVFMLVNAVFCIISYFGLGNL